MRGEAVPQRVRRHPLLDPGDLGGGVDGAVELACRERLDRIAPRKQPAARQQHAEPPALAPPVAQQFEQLRRVFGVRAIAQEIEIRLPSDKKTGDDEIAKRAADILRWRVGVPADQITIKVEKGVVTLDGEVDCQFQRKQAENAVHNLTGVIGINNLICVRARPQIPKIKEKIQQALKRSAELDSSQVTVHAEGGTVVLGGKVHAWFERDLAEQAAWSALGVTDVQDHIEIEPWAPVITRGSLQ
jgi:osmotically-inducible protein OsmY